MGMKRYKTRRGRERKALDSYVDGLLWDCFNVHWEGLAPVDGVFPVPRGCGCNPVVLDA